MLDKYCREVETYLCRKNEGHLIRIVGPAFERVCAWAEQGIPLKIAFRGIDRYCERYYAKGIRRRPVRVEFCEADILEAFDDWRRAVGVGATGQDEGAAVERPGRKTGLASHIERATARLQAVDRGLRSTRFLAVADRITQRLEALATEARGARGDNRTRIVAELAVLDRELLTAAATEMDDVRVRALQKEADEELAPFGARMSSEAREHARQAGFERLVREALALPTLSYE